MAYMTIGEVSSKFHISARMLRYYEKEGLIESTRKEGYAYRVFDDKTVIKIRQIIILRKLQIPLKQIRRMMEGSKEEAIGILETRIFDMKEQERSVQIMREAIEQLLMRLRENNTEKNHMDFVQENTMVELTEVLSLEKYHLKEEPKKSKPKEMMEKGKSVRIVQLPPSTIASYQFIGDNPEENAGKIMDVFIRSSKLFEKKPDARLFGFNNPDYEPGSDFHGYEEWLTIPDDMEVPAPLVKKRFSGRFYAAFTIMFPDFHEWSFLTEWVEQNETYQADVHNGAGKDAGGCLEEYLNWVYSSHMGWPENGVDGQVDLLMPIKKREA